jgi:hypothetical protein
MFATVRNVAARDPGVEHLSDARVSALSCGVMSGDGIAWFRR